MYGKSKEDLTQARNAKNTDLDADFGETKNAYKS